MSPVEPGKKEPGNLPTDARWSAKTQGIARDIYKALGHEMINYDGHAEGADRCIDVMIAPLGQRHTDAQYADGVEVCRYIYDHWRQWGVNYIIFSGGINFAGHSGGWQPYKHWLYKKGSSDPETKKHQDHVHLSLKSP